MFGKPIRCGGQCPSQCCAAVALPARNNKAFQSWTTVAANTEQPLIKVTVDDDYSYHKSQRTATHRRLCTALCSYAEIAFVHWLYVQALLTTVPDSMKASCSNSNQETYIDERKFMCWTMVWSLCLPRPWQLQSLLHLTLL